MPTYNIQSFIEAHVAARRFEGKHPDLATFYAARYRALCLAFGFDVQHLPGGLPDAFNSAVTAILRTHGAFDGSMEAPRLVGALIQRHGAIIDNAVAALRKAHFDLLLDILEVAHGPCDKVVTSDDLRKLGFDDSSPPDSVDYW